MIQDQNIHPSRFQNNHPIQNSPQYFQENIVSKVPVSPPYPSTRSRVQAPTAMSYSTPHKIDGVTYLGEDMRRHPPERRFPTWIWCLVAIICALIIGGLIYYFCFRNPNKALEPIEGAPVLIGDGAVFCPEGYFQKNGKCLTCPVGFQWNGSSCQIVTPRARIPQFRPEDLAEFIQTLYRSDRIIHHSKVAQQSHLRKKLSH